MLKLRRLAIVLILIAHVILGTAFGVVTPIFEAPDEDGHFLFVRYLQVHRTLPVQTLDANGPRAHHPPLYHLLGALLTAWVPVSGSADRVSMMINPHVWYRYDDPDRDNKAQWVHYGPEERWPYAGQARSIHLIRLLSLAFSAMSVWLTYQAARQVRPTDFAFAFLATGLLAFNPMVLFMSGVVQNNTTMLASGAAIVFSLSAFIRQGFTLSRWMLVGIILSVGVLLQLSALTLAAPIGLALLYEAWRTRRVLTVLEGGLGLLIPVVLLTSWWFVRNRMLYGDWTGNSVVQAMWCCDSIRPAQAMKLFLTGLLGRFGQGLMITFPQIIYLIAGLFVIIALAGLVRLVRLKSPLRGKLHLRSSDSARLPTFRSSAPDSRTMLWAVHLVTALGVGGALLFYAVTVAPGLPGRYLFAAYPSLALLLAAGSLAWFHPRWHTATAGLIVLLNLGAALYALFGLLFPTYRMPPVPSQAELRRMTPLDAHIGETARVLGYKLNKSQIKPGEDLTVTVYWLPQSKTDIPYTVFIHLYEPSVGSIAQRDTYPGLGNYATTVWDPGRAFVDTYRLHLPEDAPIVSSAKILLGLYDETTMQRLPVTGENAGPPEESWVEFGDISLRPNDP